MPCLWANDFRSPPFCYLYSHSFSMQPIHKQVAYLADSKAFHPPSLSTPSSLSSLCDVVDMWVLCVCLFYSQSVQVKIAAFHLSPHPVCLLELSRGNYVIVKAPPLVLSINQHLWIIAFFHLIWKICVIRIHMGWMNWIAIVGYLLLN